MELFEIAQIELIFSIVSVVISVIAVIVFLSDYLIIDREKSLVNDIFVRDLIKEKLPKLSKKGKVDLLYDTIGDISISRYVKDESFNEKIDYLLLANIKN